MCGRGPSHLQEVGAVAIDPVGVFCVCGVHAVVDPVELGLRALRGEMPYVAGSEPAPFGDECRHVVQVHVYPVGIAEGSNARRG